MNLLKTLHCLVFKLSGTKINLTFISISCDTLKNPCRIPCLKVGTDLNTVEMGLGKQTCSVCGCEQSQGME